MFDNGSIWRPPPMNPYATSTQTPAVSQPLAPASSAAVHSITPKQEIPDIVPEMPRKQMLTDKYDICIHIN